MGKLYLVILFLSFFSLCNGSLSVDIDYGMRYIYDSYSGEYLEQYFIEKLTIENNSDLFDVAYIGLRPTEDSSVSIGHGTIHIYSTNELLYSHQCLDDYLDPLQSIRGASLIEYIGPSDLFSTINDGGGMEDLWYIVPKDYLTTGPIDCTHFEEIKVSFMSWLNIDGSNYAQCKFEVSINGTDWVTLWSNTPEPITDNDWNKMEYDISEYADDNPTVYFRWGYQIIDRAYPYSGWNIDDVELWGTL